tara:strand:- start:5349 stop:5540 length:192 start_codon:yes stop_codon:yes gene_type:complete
MPRLIPAHGFSQPLRQKFVTNHVERHYVILAPTENQSDSIDILSIVHETSKDQLAGFLEDRVD